MIVVRNNAITLYLFLQDVGAGANQYKGKTGQGSLLFLRYSLDGGAFSASSTVIAELDATNLPGVYTLAVPAAETNGTTVLFEVRHENPLYRPFMNPRLQTGQTEARFVPISGDDPTDYLMLSTITDPTQVQGTGWVAGSTLESIRDTYDQLVAPFMATGLTVTELSGQGWLSAVSTKARRWADEGSLSAKITPTIMLEMIRSAVREIWVDLSLLNEHPVAIRHDITIVEGQQDYILPPTIGVMLRIAVVDSATGLIEREIDVSSPWNPAVQGFYLEGNLFRLTHIDAYPADTAIQIMYMPSGDIYPHLGTVDRNSGFNAEDTEMVLDSTPTDGTLDKRPNAYAGYVVNFLPTPTSVVQHQNTIATSDNTADTITVRTPWVGLPPRLGDPTYSVPATITYEVVPMYATLFEDVVAIHVARSILTPTGNTKKLNALNQRFREMQRALRLQLAKWQLRDASRFDNRTYDNAELPWWPGAF